jgi:hypothetical protein
LPLRRDRPLPEHEGGGYLIEFPDLPGCMSDGETIEVIMGGIDAMRIEAMRAEAIRSPRRPALRRPEPPATCVNCFTTTPRLDGID